MKLKDELIKIKKQLLKKNYYSKNPLSLNAKIEEFLVWYVNNEVELVTNDNHENMKAIIEKWAIWYEEKYPNETIINKEYKSAKDTNEFLSELTLYEKSILNDYKYPNIIYIDLKNGDCGHFHVNENGIITKFDRLYNRREISFLNKTSIKIDDNKYNVIGDLFIGKTVEQGYELLKRMNPTKDCLEYKSVINEKQKHFLFREEFLDAVMYRIIERGNNNYGPRRGLLFAKEFNRNIEIPMMYGINPIDFDLKSFIDEYIMLGGRTDLECIYDYFYYKDQAEYRFVILDRILKNYDKRVLKK